MADAKCEKCRKANASTRLRVAGQSIYLCDSCAVRWYQERDKAVAERFSSWKASK